MNPTTPNRWENLPMTRPTPWDEMPAWEQRLRARRVGLPDWAEEAPDRCAVVATTEEGVVETHSWTPGTEPVQLTRRPDGTVDATIDPNGEWVWWFDDTNGDEYGVWRRQPFGAAPGQQVDDPTGLPAAYSAGLDLGRSGLVVVGSNDDEYGTRIHALTAGAGSPRLLYAHRETAYVGGLSRDEALLALSHSEHGDSRHPALRVVRATDGETVGELWDGPGKSLRPAGFAPVAGDQRLLVIHERGGVPGLLLWDPVDDPTGSAVRELPLAAPGEVTDVDWFPAADALLVALDHEARTRLWRLDLTDGTTRPLGPATGTVSEAGVRPDGDVWLSWSSAATPPAIRSASGDVVLEPLGPRAPGSVAVQDVWVDGPGGRVHALLRLPSAGTAPYPTVFEVHGGPEWHDPDAFTGYASAYVDQGYAVVNVNYRGSTGYGTAWRDAIGERIGHTELADILAVRDHLVDAGVVDRERVALSGSSWGGYLTLLGLGSQPDAWSVGIASCRWPTTWPPTRTRWRRSSRSTAPCSAAHRTRSTTGTSTRARSPTSRRSGPRCSCWPVRTTPAARSARSTTTSPGSPRWAGRTRCTGSTPATDPWSTTSAWPSSGSSSTSSRATSPRRCNRRSRRPAPQRIRARRRFPPAEPDFFAVRPHPADTSVPTRSALLLRGEQSRASSQRGGLGRRFPHRKGLSTAVGGVSRRPQGEGRPGGVVGGGPDARGMAADQDWMARKCRMMRRAEVSRAARVSAAMAAQRAAAGRLLAPTVDEAEVEALVLAVRCAVGACLRAGRRRESLSQRELATRLGVSCSTVARLESGRGEPKLADVVRALAAVGGRLVIERPMPESRAAGAFVRDRAGRRLPAHLRHYRLNDPHTWWPGTTDSRWWDREPTWSYERRLPRTARR